MAALRYTASMSGWAFVSKHGYALLCIARDPNSRLIDIAASVGITERAAHTLVSQLVEGGYLTKTKDGNRNSYEVQRDASMRHPLVRHQTIGQLLDALGSDPISPDSTVPTD
jgi:hypothetical protein